MPQSGLTTLIIVLSRQRCLICGRSQASIGYIKYICAYIYTQVISYSYILSLYLAIKASIIVRINLQLACYKVGDQVSIRSFLESTQPQIIRRNFLYSLLVPRPLTSQTILVLKILIFLYLVQLYSLKINTLQLRRLLISRSSNSQNSTLGVIIFPSLQSFSDSILYQVSFVVRNVTRFFLSLPLLRFTGAGTRLIQIQSELVGIAPSSALDLVKVVLRSKSELVGITFRSKLESFRYSFTTIDLNYIGLQGILTIQVSLVTSRSLYRPIQLSPS